MKGSDRSRKRSRPGRPPRRRGLGKPLRASDHSRRRGDHGLPRGRPKAGKLGLLLLLEILAALAVTAWWLHYDLQVLAPVEARKPMGPARPSSKSHARSVLKKKRIRVGDPGSVFDPSRFDERFPDMKEWARAGVRGGIPFRKDTRVMKTITPGDGIQEAIDATALAGGGVLLLAPGTYRVDEVLDMRSGVILRGQDRDSTVLENHQRTPVRNEREFLTLAFPEVKRSGVEDLTMVHAAVKAVDVEVYRGKYVNDPNGIKDLHVGHVNIWKSEDCWVDNCRLLYAGTDPLIVYNSKHVTLRDNLIAGSFNKGVGGAGYYRLRGSEYVLCFKETVRGLRHFTLQSGQKYSVVVDCDIETDLNFHAADGGHNLVENCRINPPKGHRWEPIAHGYAKYPPPGPGNLLYRIEATMRGKKQLSKGVKCDPEAVFSIPTKWKRSMVYRLDVAPPRARTFYPVTGERGRTRPPGQERGPQ